MKFNQKNDIDLVKLFMTNIQILRDIEKYQDLMSKCLQKFREHSRTSELDEERDRIERELEQKVLKSSLSDWNLGKDGNVYSVWQKELELDDRPLQISSDLFMKIKGLFVEEIKQNPQDWHIEKEENNDPYFDMLVLKHRSGRKHYKSKSHYIWGFSIEEWEDIQKALNNQDNRENFPKKNENEGKSIGQLLGYLQQKNKEELEKKIQELEQKVDCVPEEYKLLDDLREQLRRLNNDQKNSKEEEKPVKKNDNSNVDYDNWTKEQLIAEIERLKVENEWLRNNQTLISSEKQTRIQQNQQKLAQITSYVNTNSQLTNSSNNFPANLAIGGIGIIALLGLIIVKKNKMKKCNQQ